MGRHTPGPWEIRQTAMGVSIVGRGERFPFATLGANPYPGDARLIAAAPELLEAICALGALPEGYCFCFGGVRDALKPEKERTGECRDLRAAIAKAEAR